MQTFTKSRFSLAVLLLCLLTILQPNTSGAQESGRAQRFTISGYVREQGSRELLIGVNVYVPKLRTGTTTNAYGFYSITLPADSLEVIFSFVGYQAVSMNFNLNKNIDLDVFLSGSFTLGEVEIKGERVERISESVRMSTIDVPISDIKAIPALLGEKDVLKVLQLLPGVQRGIEGSSGFYVRGGGPDQNLIILDDATVYNASHLFGFFSLFNGDAIKSIELTKGGMPARYGGRLSSVLDINMKDGNKKKHSGEAGIGLISSRLTLEGPIVEDKASYLFSGRRTYVDVLARPFMPKEGVAGYFFYDMNAKLNYDLDRKNKFYASGYFGRDKFYARERGSSSLSEAGLFWQNATSTLRWNHLINNRMFSNTSFVYSKYIFQIYMKSKYLDDIFDLKYYSGIEDLSLKSDFSWHPSARHTVRFGVSATHHAFNPSALVIETKDLDEILLDVKTIRSVETGIYIEDEIKATDRLRLMPGIRLSGFFGKNMQHVKPEPRFSASYNLKDDLALKASYAKMNQYVHLLSNTGLGLPTDLWVPSVENVPPQESWQVAAGFAKDFLNQNFSLSVEAYYKEGYNLLGYSSGASFLMFDDPTGANAFDWTRNVASGLGWFYGAEIMLQRKTGKLTGWIGYTLSKALGAFEEKNIAPLRHDRPHDLSIVANYKLSKEFQFSAVWVYSSGNPIVIPSAGAQSYYHTHGIDPMAMIYPDYDFPQYTTDFINVRAEAYHRLDVGMQFIRQKELFGRKIERVIDLSVYNAYNRKNPFFYFEDLKQMPDGSYQRILSKMTLFPIIPSLTFSYKF